MPGSSPGMTKNKDASVLRLHSCEPQERHSIYLRHKRLTAYICVTSDLPRRITEHRESLNEGFTKRHSVKRLVFIEEHQTAESAIKREKTIKSWPRSWKIDLIEKDNPDWFDLYRRLNW
jgi:putative endonuclease